MRDVFDSCFHFNFNILECIFDGNDFTMTKEVTRTTEEPECVSLEGDGFSSVNRAGRSANPLRGRRRVQLLHNGTCRSVVGERRQIASARCETSAEGTVEDPVHDRHLLQTSQTKRMAAGGQQLRLRKGLEADRTLHQLLHPLLIQLIRLFLTRHSRAIIQKNSHVGLKLSLQ